MRASFSSAFFRRDLQAQPFLPADYRDAAARQAHVQTLARRQQPVSDAVFAELARQQATLEASAARARNLDALRQPGTVAVVTGQQIGLFLGPLYTFYKAASAIDWARRIEAESGVRCVPIFWLQTEDHDIEEIRHCHVPTADGDPPFVTLSLSDDPPGSSGGSRDAPASQNRQSVEHRLLGPAIDDLISQLGDALHGLPYQADCVARVAAHYRAGVALSDAFAQLLASLFADEGLLVLNPRRVALAQEAEAVYRIAITQQAELNLALSARGQDLAKAGFQEQVTVRPQTSLFFFHETATGPRFRLEHQPASDRWLAPPMDGRPQQVLSTHDLLAQLAHDPLCFSTSALLRPLLQDFLLPTVAYVGGPGEINYWAQLAPLYQAAQQSLPICQPLVVPRARFRCLDESTRALLAKLNLTPIDLEQPRQDALQRAQLRRSTTNPSDVSTMAASHTLDSAAAIDALRQQLLADVKSRVDALGQTEPGLRDAVRRTHVSIERNVDRLLRRYQRIRDERDVALCQRIDRLQRVLYPHGEPQERHDSLPYYLARFGLQAIKERVFHSLSLHDCGHTAVRDLDL